MTDWRGTGRTAVRPYGVGRVWRLVAGFFALLGMTDWWGTGRTAVRPYGVGRVWRLVAGFFALLGMADWRGTGRTAVRPYGVGEGLAVRGGVLCFAGDTDWRGQGARLCAPTGWGRGWRLVAGFFALLGMTDWRGTGRTAVRPYGVGGVGGSWRDSSLCSGWGIGGGQGARLCAPTGWGMGLAARGGILCFARDDGLAGTGRTAVRPYGVGRVWRLVAGFFALLGMTDWRGQGARLCAPTGWGGSGGSWRGSLLCSG